MIKEIDSLEKIKTEILNCKKCPLYKTRNHSVVGEGSSRAKIMFCGEAPGYNEDKTGRPFCGAAGKILDELLESAEIKREEVFVTNILKCRPPSNRDPRSEEIKACTPYLEGQIEIIKPGVICTLGNFSTAYIFQKYGLKDQIQGISKIHGKIFEATPTLNFGVRAKSIKIIPLYHPAVATYNINMKEVLKRDFRALKNL